MGKAGSVRMCRPRVFVGSKSKWGEGTEGEGTVREGRGREEVGHAVADSR